MNKLNELLLEREEIEVCLKNHINGYPGCDSKERPCGSIIKYKEELRNINLMIQVESNTAIDYDFIEELEAL